MPTAIWIIGAAIFAQGTSELMLAGLLPELAADMSVTIPQAGLSVSVFALGMLLGAPISAIVTLRWPRRRAMVVFLAIFVVSHIAGAMTSSYPLLLALRFGAAFVYAGFWSVGAGTTMGLVAKRVRNALAPAGRMALTNYLGQSSICVLIFTGCGLGLVG